MIMLSATQNKSRYRDVMVLVEVKVPCGVCTFTVYLFCPDSSLSKLMSLIMLSPLELWISGLTLNNPGDIGTFYKKSLISD